MSIGRRIMAAVLTASVVFAGSAVGIAQADEANKMMAQEERNVRMFYPRGGEHTMRFVMGTICNWDKNNPQGPIDQSISHYIYDKDEFHEDVIDAASSHFLTHNSYTVKWKNRTTGQEGTFTGRTLGSSAMSGHIKTGIGEIETTVTLTRSLLPTLHPGSSVPFVSGTHSETFVLPAASRAACGL